MEKQNKINVSFKLEPEKVEMFKIVCEALNSTVSHELRLFANRFIEQHQKKALSLSEFKKKHNSI